MFPNVRLLIAALFASVVALSCGFGVFAALRVNRDPLSRLPTGTTALQLVANEAAAAPAAWGAPFGSGFRLSEAQAGGTATDVPALAPSAEVSQPPSASNAWTTGTVRAEATSDAVPVHEAQPTPMSAATTPPASNPASAEPPEGEPTALAVPAVAALEPVANSPPPAAPPADVTGTVPDAAAPAPEAKVTESPARKSQRSTLRKVARYPMEQQRLTAKKRVVRKTKAPAVAQLGDKNSTYQEPVFQSAPDAFQRPPAANRGGAKKSANNTVPNDPFAWPSAQ